MTAAEPQHEPTMEEILASIRKIISEDQPEQVDAKAPTPAIAVTSAPAPAPMFDTDVLELTEEVVDDVVVPLIPAPPPAPPPPQEPDADDIEFQTADETPDDEKPDVEQTMAADGDDLISDRTRSAVERVLEGIDQETPPPVQRVLAPAPGGLDALFIHAIQGSFEPTLKDWVQNNQAEVFDNLKPLIREWMDANLPDLIETAVQKEIARAVSARRR